MTGPLAVGRRAGPALTVVVWALDAPGHLARTLESLRGQALDAAAFEVVVVEAGSADAAAAGRSLATPFPLRYARLPGAPRPVARNHGCSLAEGELLIFLDAGDVAAPDLLAAHADTHAGRAPREAAVVGSWRLAPELEGDPAMRFAAGPDALLFAQPAAGDVLAPVDLREARFSCRRAPLVDSGGFHPALRAGCEDVELAHRLSRRGIALVPARHGAVTTAARRLTFDDLCERMEAEGRSRVAVSELCDDEAVRRWAGVAAAAASWARVGPAYEALRRSGRNLDRIARMRLEAGLGLDPADVALAYQGYRAAFEVSFLKGMVELAEERGRDAAARSRA